MLFTVARGRGPLSAAGGAGWDRGAGGIAGCAIAGETITGMGTVGLGPRSAAEGDAPATAAAGTSSREVVRPTEPGRAAAAGAGRAPRAPVSRSSRVSRCEIGRAHV